MKYLMLAVATLICNIALAAPNYKTKIYSTENLESFKKFNKKVQMKIPRCISQTQFGGSNAGSECFDEAANTYFTYAEKILRADLQSPDDAVVEYTKATQHAFLNTINACDGLEVLPYASYSEIAVCKMNASKQYADFKSRFHSHP